MRAHASTPQTLQGASPAPLRRPPPSRLGFTLLELMVVVGLIATIAALATPSVLRQVRARRAQREAIEVLGILQEARSRSLGRGGAVRITWDNATNTVALSELLLDVGGDGTGGGMDVGDGQQDMPAPACSTPGGTWQPSRRWFTQGQDSVLDMTRCNATDCDTLVATDFEICFTPNGRTQFRTGGAWAPLTSVVAFRIQQTEGGANFNPRFVLLTPNGIARMRL